MSLENRRVKFIKDWNEYGLHVGDVRRVFYDTENKLYLHYTSGSELSSIPKQYIDDLYIQKYKYLRSFE